MVGFFGSDQEEIAAEHAERISQYQCFKSHHQYLQLNELSTDRDKIIYVVRDPRDIVVSGAHYFNRVSPFRKDKMSQSLLGRLINKVHWILVGESKMRQEMVRAVCVGNKWIHRWCAVSWSDHVLGYKNHPNVHFVRYEDLLENPLHETEKISEFLGLVRTKIELTSAISAQSFDSVKAKFKSTGDQERLGFMRKGALGQGAKKLNSKELDNIQAALGEVLKSFGY